MQFSEFKNKLKNAVVQTKVKKLDKTISPTAIRESFFNESFKVGQTVLTGSHLMEVIDVRSNYYLLVDQAGKLHKRFHRDLAESSEKLVYPPGTFKGRPIGNFLTLIEESGETDPYSVFKAMDLLESKKYQSLFSHLKNTNMKLDFISESVKKDQIQALNIIAGAIDVKLKSTTPVDMLKELKSEFAKKRFNAEQVKIFNAMIEKAVTKLNITEVHKNPMYDTEREIFGYSGLKKQLANLSGIKNYGEQEPGETVALKLSNIDDKLSVNQSKPGNTLTFSSETHRKQLVKKLKNDD